MKCPKCKDIQLSRKGKAMSSERHSGPLFCSSCGGVWVGNNDLDRISEFSSVVSDDIDLSSIEKDRDSMTGLCPNGHGIMIRAKVHLEPHFHLEKCSSCGGIWFDYGELNRIIENNMDENLALFWTLSWQKIQREEKGKKYYHNLNKELLGDDIYNLVLSLSQKLKDHPHQLRALALLHHEL